MSCDISFSDVLYLTTNKKQIISHNNIKMFTFICSYKRDKGCVCGGGGGEEGDGWALGCRLEKRLYMSMEVPPKNWYLS